MLDLYASTGTETETDVHFEHVILDRLLQREAAARVEHAWPDEPPSALPEDIGATRARERATWEALHQAMCRLNGVPDAALPPPATRVD